jgi:hypothetical protein
MIAASNATGFGSGTIENIPDAVFLDGLKLLEDAAHDERNLVKKAVNMALRAVGKRNRALNTVGADRYRNPDDDLPGDFEVKRRRAQEASARPGIVPSRPS